MNINPILLQDLDEIIYFTHINPNTIKIEDLSIGSIIRTRYDVNDEPNNNTYILVKNNEYLKNMINISHEKNKTLKYLIQPNKDKNKLSYLTLINYDNWPKHNSYDCFDVIDIWETNIDVDIFKTREDVIEFFNKYNINDL